MAKIYPVLIVTYARPEGLERILKSAIEAGITVFYVAIDGPRNKEIADFQSEMSKLLQKFAIDFSLDLNIWQREENLGAACSVLTAINWFFQSETAGIILEDDLVPSLDFFSFSSRALDKYENHSEVWSIAGSRILGSNENTGLSDWSSYPMIWGWATWASKWKVMYPLLTTKPRFSILTSLSPTANFWSVGAHRSLRGLIDAWDIPLANAQRISKKYSLIPPTNLISNIGFDKNATHTRDATFPLNHPIELLPSHYVLPINVDDKSAKRYDNELMNRVYLLRRRHALLRFWAFLTDSFRSRSKNLISLDQRLSRVEYPKLGR